jgi:hypothetical protein
MAVMSVMVDGLWGPEKEEYLLAGLWVLENSKQEARFDFGLESQHQLELARSPA